MGIKKQTLNRLQDMRNRAEKQGNELIKKILSSMKTDDLRELADENTTKERFDEIWKRATNEYKQRYIKTN